MSQVINVKYDSYDVYIGRPSIYGNPFTHRSSKYLDVIKVPSRDDAIFSFRDWLLGLRYIDFQQDRRRELITNLPYLKNKILGCHCKPLSCHGDVLLTLSSNYKMITVFRDDYCFLSNFYYYPFSYKNFSYKTAEHAYQAEKTDSVDEKLLIISQKTPSNAKRLGYKVNLKSNWNFIKNNIMEDIIRAKFREPVLARLLLLTGTDYLIEGNTWGDTYWGCTWCNKDKKWIGKNHLGLLLMKIRNELCQNLNVLKVTPLQALKS
jgi:hypothetical protein